mgnify:CR=1 FL=1
MAELADLVAGRDTIVVVGPGGVGKTTTSASIALHAARQGRKVLVLTVDPARRLATALGLDALGGNEARVSPAHFAKAGVSLGSGALYAMMLDTKSTFDALVHRHAPSASARDGILNNPFYKQASTTLAGSQEYMAMEKLYELREERDYDLIVLDTPPAVNAADFFDAPERMTGFLDSGSLSFLLSGMRRAGRFGFGIFNSLLARVMNRFVGARTFMDILNFVQAFSGMFAGFKERAKRVAEMLRSPSTGFVIVSSTETVSLSEAASLHAHLKAQDMPFAALLINRLRYPHLASEDLEGLSERFLEGFKRVDGGEEADLLASAEGLEAACRDYAMLADVDAERVAEIAARFGEDGGNIWTVPLFHQDVHDIASLSAFADHVFSS